jgi:hypothetical protein
MLLNKKRFTYLVRSDEGFEDTEELVGRSDTLRVFSVERQSFVIGRVGESDKISESEDPFSCLLGEAEHLLRESIFRIEILDIFEVFEKESLESGLLGAEVG